MPTDKEMLDWLNDHPMGVVCTRSIPGGVTWRTRDGYGPFILLRDAISEAMDTENAERDKAYEWFKAGINNAESHLPQRELYWAENIRRWVVRWSNNNAHNEEVHGQTPREALLAAWRKDTGTRGKEHRDPGGWEAAEAAFIESVLKEE